MRKSTESLGALAAGIVALVVGVAITLFVGVTECQRRNGVRAQCLRLRLADAGSGKVRLRQGR